MEEIRGSEGLNTYKEERYHRDATPFSVIILTMIGCGDRDPESEGWQWPADLAIGLVWLLSL